MKEKEIFIFIEKHIDVVDNKKVIFEIIDKSKRAVIYFLKNTNDGWKQVGRFQSDLVWLYKHLDIVIYHIKSRDVSRDYFLRNKNKKFYITLGNNRDKLKLIFKLVSKENDIEKETVLYFKPENDGFTRLENIKEYIKNALYGGNKMYIRNISIKNFRNFEDVNISFNDGYQTIIGENNIGKSNLLFAIRLVLDRELSYKVRYLKNKDFYGYKNPTVDDHIIISIELEGTDLADNPCFHPLKTIDNTMRITYVYAHKNNFDGKQDEVEECEIEDFSWKLYAGGDSLDFENLIKLEKVYLRDIDGINVFYVRDFRNIYSDLRGKNQSLLSNYCITRESSEEELSEVSEILESSSEKLNKLPFIPEMKDEINGRNKQVAGSYFSPNIALGFSSDFDDDIWNELELFFESEEHKTVPINALGLGQKNLLYLTLFIAALENKKKSEDMNIVLIEEPEAHLHPQLQKILFTNLKNLTSTQVLMTSHSTHIASDCTFKNISLLYKDTNNKVKSYSPFLSTGFTEREKKLLKRYLDATRSDLFFSSAVIFVEGVAEQFIIPAICEEIYGLNLAEYNISLIPIYGRHFYTFLKIFDKNNLEIPAVVLIDGDNKEVNEDENSDETTFVKKAKELEVENRVKVFSGEDTLEIDLFPYDLNTDYLKYCFINLGHKTSYNNLSKYGEDDWKKELINRIDNTVTKGRFSQQLALEIDSEFIIPKYIKNGIEFIIKAKGIKKDD